MHTSYLLAIIGILGFTIAAPVSPNPAKRAARKFQFFGINESGAEFGETAWPGVYNKDYTWYDLSTIPTFVNKGFNTFRVNILMERLNPNGLTGPMDKNYLSNLTQTVNAITNAGAYAMINPHNYGRYKGQIITSTNDFGSFWWNLAAQYKGNSKVIFDTNNEYHDMPSKLVASLNQAAIDSIRSSGATSQTITVEGNAWTGAWTWSTATGTDGLTNDQTMGGLRDPSNKLIYQMHQYLDSDGSGTHAECVSKTIGSERLVAATNWLRSNGKKGIIGEFAGGVNAVCQAAVTDMLAYMAKNNDVWTGALWWSAGPWWADYMFSIEPKDGKAYNAYMPILINAE